VYWLMANISGFKLRRLTGCFEGLGPYHSIHTNRFDNISMACFPQNGQKKSGNDFELPERNILMQKERLWQKKSRDRTVHVVENAMSVCQNRLDWNFSRDITPSRATTSKTLTFSDLSARCPLPEKGLRAAQDALAPSITIFELVARKRK